MARRVTHSLMDPWLNPPLKALYGRAGIPSWLWPEAIVLTGHAFAVVAAVGAAFSTEYWWGGFLLAAGVALNHLSDVWDGTHARATGQCRNGGELLDHFTDPLSYSYVLLGLGLSCGYPLLGAVGVIVLYASAVLTNIKTKMTGEFKLAMIGPTEFKSLLVVYGIALALITGGVWRPAPAGSIALGFMAIASAGGVLYLLVNVVRSVHEVNRRGAAPDTTEWESRAVAETGNLRSEGTCFRRHAGSTR